MNFGIRDYPRLHHPKQLSIHGTLSIKFDLECRLRQGFCLGPLLFVGYASKIFEIVTKIHCYADDSQLYLSFCPNYVASQEATLARVER